MADILSLSELKTALNIDSTDTRKDALYTQMLPWVTDVIRSFTGRDFGVAAATETRNFEYDGSGFLDIDDASAITAVSLVVPGLGDYVLTTDQWYAAPSPRDDAPVFYYIVLQSSSAHPRVDDFLRNIGETPPASRTVKVTGTWGWPTVPGDVKLAAIWTVQDWSSKPSGEGLSAEAIEGYSRSWGSRSGGGTQALAIPNRARDILVRYMKQYV